MVFQSEQATTADKLLADTFKELMDIVDGSIYGQISRLGKTVDSNNKIGCSPDVKTLMTNHTWRLCMTTYQELFQLNCFKALSHESLVDPFCGKTGRLHSQSLRYRTLLTTYAG